MRRNGTQTGKRSFVIVPSAKAAQTQFRQIKQKRRTIVNKRIDFIDIIKQHSDDPACRQLLEELYRYYQINDVDTNGVHSEIFYALYLEDHPSYDRISEICFVSLCTLHRYRLRFNRLALALAADELKARFNISQSER